MPFCFFLAYLQTGQLRHHLAKLLSFSVIILSGRNFVLLPAELLELSVNRPLAKSENERHNYAGDWNEHKQAQCPMVAGFVEYAAKDDRLDNYPS